jgi:hypothetical protein
MGQAHCLGEGNDARWANLRVRVSVGSAGAEDLTKLDYVNPEEGAFGRICGGLQTKLVAIDVDALAAEGIAEGIERAAQGGASPGVVVLGPEQSDEGVAGVALASDGEIGDKRDGFTPVHLDRPAVALDARWPKQVECKAGHFQASFALSVLESEQLANRAFL